MSLFVTADRVMNDTTDTLLSAFARDLPDIHYKTLDTPPVDTVRRPASEDVADVWMWQQLWGDTSLGHHGMGGRAMTRATTIVVLVRGTYSAAVYFGGTFAYLINKPNQTFFNDCKSHWLVDAASATKRYECTESDRPGFFDPRRDPPLEPEPVKPVALAPVPPISRKKKKPAEPAADPTMSMIDRVLACVAFGHPAMKRL